jgi:nitrate/nitrite transporter NarK
MNKIAPYAKAVIGALVAALGALGAALTPDATGLVSVNEGEWVAVVSALLVGLLAVFAVPNKDPQAEHQDESVQPPADPTHAPQILGKAFTGGTFSQAAEDERRGR